MLILFGKKAKQLRNSLETCLEATSSLSERQDRIERAMKEWTLDMENLYDKTAQALARLSTRQRREKQKQEEPEEGRQPTTAEELDRAILEGRLR